MTLPHTLARESSGIIHSFGGREEYTEGTLHSRESRNVARYIRSESSNARERRSASATNVLWMLAEGGIPDWREPVLYSTRTEEMNARHARQRRSGELLNGILKSRCFCRANAKCKDMLTLAVECSLRSHYELPNRIPGPQDPGPVNACKFPQRSSKEPQKYQKCSPRLASPLRFDFASTSTSGSAAHLPFES